MESIFDYNEAVEYINEIPKFTKKNTIEHTKKFLERLNILQENMKIIHIAGTNGKGSVCAMLSNILVKMGKSVGLFTSPHLVKVNERVRINNEVVTDEEFTRIFNEVKKQIDIMEKEGYSHPSYFELLFLISMCIFEERKVEYVILETGLGGRLDATNAIEKPKVTVITSIGFDHMEYLGNTIEEIAGEKAGIIKENVPVVFWAEDFNVKKVIEEKAIQKKAPKFAIDYTYCKNVIKTNKSVDFCVQNGYYVGCNFTLPFICEYQVQNALLAINVAGILLKEDENVLKEALKDVVWEGRMEEVKDGVFFDGAHNGPGIDEFVKTFDGYKCSGKKYILFSVVKDKDYDYMLSKIAKTKVDKIYGTGLLDTRGLDEQEIKKDFEKYNCNTKIEIYSNSKEAFKRALEEKKDEDVLFCVGSLYLIGELKKLEF